MLLRILVVFATASAAGSDLLDISVIDGSPHRNKNEKEGAIDRDNKTYYKSILGNDVKHIHVSLTEAAMVNQVVILNR